MKTYGPITLDDVSVVTEQIAKIIDYQRSPGLRHARTVLADTQGIAGGRALQICYVGDSITEGFYAVAARSMRWVDQLNLRLSSGRGGIGRWIQPSSGLYNDTTTVSSTSWPASDPCVRYSGTIGQFGKGLASHGATIATGGYIEVDYIGDLCTVFYQRSASASGLVTIDGGSVGTIGTGAVTQDLYQQFGTAGNYGFHTLRVTASGGTFNCEGFQTSDVLNTVSGILTNGVMPWEAARGAFRSGDFSSSSDTDSLIDGQPIDLFVIGLGQNDITTSVALATYISNMLTLMTRLDGRANSNASAVLKRPGVGFLLIAHWTFPDTWVAALRALAVSYGRTTVVDMREHFEQADIAINDADYGLSEDGIHPNDRGHTRYAEVLFNIISPQANHPRLLTPTHEIIDAWSTPAARSNWAENFSYSPSGQRRVDKSPTVITTVSEKRYRRWFDAGVYEFRLELDEGTDQGNGSLWFDGTQIGSNFDAFNATSQITAFYGGQVTVAVSKTGWHYVTVRKNGTKNGTSSAYGITPGALHIMRKTVTPT